MWSDALTRSDSNRVNEQRRFLEWPMRVSSSWTGRLLAFANSQTMIAFVLKARFVVCTVATTCAFWSPPLFRCILFQVVKRIWITSDYFGFMHGAVAVLDTEQFFKKQHKGSIDVVIDNPSLFALSLSASVCLSSPTKQNIPFLSQDIQGPLSEFSYPLKHAPEKSPPPFFCLHRFCICIIISPQLETSCFSIPPSLILSANMSPYLLMCDRVLLVGVFALLQCHS